MMSKKATFKITYIGEISTKILALPYVGEELNMLILLPDEDTDLRTVRIFSPMLPLWRERSLWVSAVAALSRSQLTYFKILFVVLGMEPRVLSMLSKHSITELYPSPSWLLYLPQAPLLIMARPATRHHHMWVALSWGLKSLTLFF